MTPPLFTHSLVEQPSASWQVLPISLLGCGSSLCWPSVVPWVLPPGEPGPPERLSSVPPQAVEDAAGRREDREAYPWRDAVHEAVVNALVHRDYARAGARVRVLLFSDRLEIRSPGALPNGLTVEQVRLGATSHRNTLLVEVMHQLGHVETVGRGIHRIFATMRARGAAEPGFAEQAGEVVVTFSPAPV